MYAHRNMKEGSGAASGRQQFFSLPNDNKIELLSLNAAMQQNQKEKRQKVTTTRQCRNGFIELTLAVN